MYESPIREPLVLGNKDYHQITEDICNPLERKRTRTWHYVLYFSISLMLLGGWGLYKTFHEGIGAWGVNNSVGWGWGIINFVWWIGIGHAGTAFSIFLLVLRQRWRTAINRSAEAMTVFAVICAGMYPIVHMGRAWLFFFVFPYPNARGPLWVNFNSPLLWDVFAIGTYILASATFWYLGMMPDFATIRDRTKSKVRKYIYGFLSFGWNGSVRTWMRFESLSMILGGLTAALVVSVHSIVAMDFATSVVFGWHTTIFPPYFVVGAIFSGFAMVLTLMILVRKAYKFEEYVTVSHIEAIAKVIIFMSLIMGTGYATEVFVSWYSGNTYEIFTFFHNRLTGDYTLPYYMMITCNAIIPQLFWFKKIRRNMTVVFIISLLINLGMWFERYVIVITSLTKDYIPANWADYTPSAVEIAVFLGTIGFFIFGLCMFLKYFPIIAISEVKAVLKPGKKPKWAINGNEDE